MKKRVLAFTAVLFVLLLISAISFAEGQLFDTLEEAASYVREQLIARERTIVVDISENVIGDSFPDDIIRMANRYDCDPLGGDYLVFSIWSGNYNVSIETINDGQRLTLQPDYITSAFRETITQRSMTDILTRLCLDGLTDLEKTERIYDYLCRTVFYDYNAYWDTVFNHAEMTDDRLLGHSAYGALLRDCSVCQGFALSLYRMLNSVGIECRIVCGDSESDEGSHAWNIVKIDEKWYYLDATWDAGEEKYSYFLKGENDFLNHDGFIRYDYTVQESTLDYTIAETGINCVISHFADYDFSLDEKDNGGEAYQEPLYEEDDSYGTIGDIRWQYNGETHVLIIEGTGKLDDFNAQQFSAVEIFIGEGITAIGNGVFEGMERYLKRVELPEGLETIGDNAFMNCKNLEWINLPDSVVSIGALAFYNCYVMDTEALPSGLLQIGRAAFVCCLKLTVPEIPAGVTRIEDSTFFKCRMLNVRIPDGVVYIGQNSFLSCDALTEIVIPNGVEVVQEGAFRDCINLRSAIIGDGVKTIEQYAFQADGALSDVTLPAGLVRIEQCAFEMCYSLSKVVYPGGRDTIRGTLQLPPALEYLGTSAFNYCAGIHQIEWNNPNIQFDVGTFSDSGIVSMTIPQGMNEIPNCSFFNCYSLKRVLVHGGVRTVGYTAFSTHRDLECVIFEGDAPAFDADSFMGTTAEIRYPANNETWNAVIGNHYGGQLTWSSYGEGDSSTLNLYEKELLLGVGEEHQLIWETKGNITLLCFTSSDDSIISVDDEGRMLARKPGTATITITDSKTGISDWCSVTVAEEPVSISFDCELYVIPMQQDIDLPIKPHFYPEGSYSPVVSMTYGNWGIMLMDDGHAYASGETEATIYVTLLNGVQGTFRIISIRTFEEHTLEGIPGIPATCTESGLTDGIVCGDCGKVFRKQEPLPAAGHSLQYVESISLDGPHAEYTEKYVCSKCGQYVLFNGNTYVDIVEYGCDIPIANVHFCEEGACKMCGQSFDIHQMNALNFPIMQIIIEEEAFMGVDAHAIILPKGSKVVEKKAFADCPKLRYVFVPYGIEYIAEDAFEGSNVELIFY